MLMAFTLNKGLLEQVAINAASDLVPDVIWVDAIAPTEEERLWLQEAYGQVLPSIEEIYEIEATSRFYENEHGLHISSYFLNYADENSENISAAFIFSGERLFTLREEELAAFRLFRLRARKGLVTLTNSKSIMLGLFETKVENLADIVERIAADLEKTSRQVLGNAEQDDMEQVLTDLARQEDINGKVRISIRRDDGEKPVVAVEKAPSESFWDRVLEGTLLKDFVTGCIENLFEFAKKELGPFPSTSVPVRCSIAAKTPSRSRVRMVASPAAITTGFVL